MSVVSGCLNIASVDALNQGTRSNSNYLPRIKKIVAAIPCYNTERHIGDVIKAAKKYIDHVIVIDDGSTDKTAEVARAAGAIVVSHGTNKSYGEAIKSCIEAARKYDADILVILDGDGQHDPEEIPAFLNAITHDGAELVIGSRFISNGKRMPSYRKFGIRLINSLWNFGSSVKVTDTQSGFRAYGKRVLNNMQFSEKGMGISIEIIEKARKNSVKIAEVAITCSYENNNSTFSIKAFMHGFSVAYSVLRIRFNNSLTKAA